MLRRLVLTGAIAALALAAVPAVSSATFDPGARREDRLHQRPSAGRGALGTECRGRRRKNLRDRFPGARPSRSRRSRRGNSPAPSAELVARPHPHRLRGAAPAPAYALWILDLRTGSQTEFVPPTAGLDRPSWSPDGTQIAYGAEGDLWVKGVEPETTPVRVTDNAGTTRNGRSGARTGTPSTTTAASHPAGNTRHLQDQPGHAVLAENPDHDRRGTTTGSPPSPRTAKRLCFLRGPQNERRRSNGQRQRRPVTPILATTAGGEHELRLVPGRDRRSSTRGRLREGELATARYQRQHPALLEQLGSAEHFDGNADWATNFSPKCDPKTARSGSTASRRSRFPAPTRTSASEPNRRRPTPLESEALEIVDAQPSHGTLGGLSQRQGRLHPQQGLPGAPTPSPTRAPTAPPNAPPATVTIQVGQRSAAVATTRPRRRSRGEDLGQELAARQAREDLRGAGRHDDLLQAQRGSARDAHLPAQANGRQADGAASLLVRRAAKAGKNKVRFQGLLTKIQRLAPGSYRLLVERQGRRRQPVAAQQRAERSRSSRE